MKNILTLLLTFLLACPPAQGDDALTLSQEAIDNLGVSLGKLAIVNELPLLEAPANAVVLTAREYVVSSAQAGLVTRLLAGNTEPVKKGQLLAQIDSPELLALQSQYLKANSQLQLASTAYQRDQKLIKDGVIAERRAQETTSQYQAAVLDVGQAKQLLVIAGMTSKEIAALDKSHHLTGQLNVYAPISGVVLERLVMAGTRVDNQMPLYRIADLGELWLDMNIPQEHIADIKRGDLVQWRGTASVQGQSDGPALTGEIIQLGANVNPDNQTVLVRAKLKNNPASPPALLLRAGQKTTMQILQKLAVPAFSVPNNAIAQHDGKAWVFVRTASGFTVHPVTVIGKQAAHAIITGGLTGNEQIAIAGAAALKANWLGLGSDE